MTLKSPEKVPLELNQAGLERIRKIADTISKLSLAYDRRADETVINEELKARQKLLPPRNLDLREVVVCVLDEDIRRATLRYDALVGFSLPQTPPENT